MIHPSTKIGFLKNISTAAIRNARKLISSLKVTEGNDRNFTRTASITLALDFIRLLFELLGFSKPKNEICMKRATTRVDVNIMGLPMRNHFAKFKRLSGNVVWR